MTKDFGAKASEILDFEVLPSPAKNAVAIFEIFNELSNQRGRKEVLERRLGSESDTEFFLATAINSVEMTTALFRKNKSANPLLTSTWLSLINEKAKRIALTSHIQGFSELSESGLRLIAKRSIFVDEIRHLPTFLAEKFGIILVIESSFSSMKTDGCAFKLSSGTPVIGLSLRYNRYDNFWFTLMHELSHVTLHYDQLGAVIIDDLDADDETEVEAEANRMAADSLIPRNIWRKILLHKNSLAHLTQFSEDAGIHPTIAAGMLRNQTANFANFSSLVNSIDLKNKLGLIDA